MSNNPGFYKIKLDLKTNLFSELSNATTFESVAKGRIGNHLVNMDDNGVPIVRTTTKYNIPAHNFLAVHHMMVTCINDTIKEDGLTDIPVLHFNNALIEVYDASYAKMNYHSDHSLDLADDSYIGVFSCYEEPDELLDQHTRKLKIRDKITNEESEITLTHNSVVLFSMAANRTFQHKIVLDYVHQSRALVAENKWLGITFRTSKTYVRFDGDVPCFSDAQLLTLADKEQEAEFFRLRGQENRNLDFVYPALTYTINIADLMIPENGKE